MPNVIGAGLWGWPKELDGSTPMPAKAVFGVRPGEDVWRAAEYVWAWCEGTPDDPDSGSWQLIWARVPKAATAVTISYAPTTVTVNWTVPSPNTAQQWIVRRQDGTEVGRVAGNVTTLQDIRPKINSGESPTNTAVSYTVAAYDGVSESARLQSNVLNISLDPATVSAVPSYPSADPGSTANVTVSWTPNATWGNPDNWRVWGNGQWYTGDLPGGQTSVVLTGVVRGAQYNFRAVPFMLDPAGVLQQAGNSPGAINCNVAPNNPRPQYWRAVANTKFQLEFVFFGPTAGYATDYELQHFIGPGPWTHWGFTTSAGPHILTTNQVSYARVRTRAPGGVSDWMQVGPATPITDETGPGPPTIRLWQPEASYGRMHLKAHMPTNTDLARAQVYVMNNHEGWNLLWDGAVNNVTELNLYWQANQQAVAKVIVRPFDIYGNQGTDAYAEWILAPPVYRMEARESATVRTPYGGNPEWFNIGGGYLLTGNTLAGEHLALFYYADVPYQYAIYKGSGALDNGYRTITGATFDYFRENTAGEYNCIDMRFFVTQAQAPAGAPPWFGGAGGGPPLGGDGDHTQCLARTTAYGPTWWRGSLPTKVWDWWRQGWVTFAFAKPGAGYSESYQQLGGHARFQTDFVPGPGQSEGPPNDFLSGNIFISSLG